MRPEALPDYVLVVNIENNTRTVDYRDRRTAVLWGDASAAAVVSARDPVAGPRQALDAGPVRPRRLGQGGHPGRRPLRAGRIGRAGLRDPQVGLHDLGAGRPPPADPAEMLFIGHQANLMMLNSVCERAGVAPLAPPVERGRVRQLRRSGRAQRALAALGPLPPACELALVVVGSGLTWGGVLIEVGRSV